MRNLFYGFVIICLLFYSVSGLANDNTGEFEQIVKIAFEKSPEIKKAYSKLKMAKGDSIQSAYFPNPEFEVEVENFGGNLGKKTFSSAEMTFYLTQKIELGNKRKYRKQTALKNYFAALEDCKVIVNEKLARIFIQYNKTSIASKRLEIAKKLYQLSEESLKVVSERVKYGKTSPIQKIKAQLELEKAYLKLQEAKTNFENLKKNLANELGITEIPPSIKFTGFLPEQLDIAELSIEEKISNLPLIKKGEFLQKATEMELKLTKSYNIPDLNISVGLRKFRETDQTAYVVSFGINLPLFNRNKGLIMKKAAQRDIAFLELKKNKINLKNSFESALNSLMTAQRETEIYQKKLIPKAKKAYQSVFVAYKEGKLNYLDFLDTQRTLIFIENEYLAAKEKYVSSIGTFLELSGYFSENFLNYKSLGVENE